MQTTPIEGKTFGAVVTDVSLANLTDAEFPDIRSAFNQYGFLVFPEQFLSVEGNTAFAKRFGKLHYDAHPMANKVRREDGSYGDTVPYQSQRMRGVFGNQNWHTDSSYMPISSKCGILSAVTVPEWGGETEFADMRAGYAALDQATKGPHREPSRLPFDQAIRGPRSGRPAAGGREQHLPPGSVPAADRQGCIRRQASRTCSSVVMRSAYRGCPGRRASIS